MDQGDPEGALSCALQALRISAGPEAAAWSAARRDTALQVCRTILEPWEIRSRKQMQPPVMLPMMTWTLITELQRDAKLL
eukprot:g11308.t1